MSLYLIRHGETAWSLSGRHTGRTDLPLTANGEAQAARLRPWMQTIPFTRVLTSPLQRARRTCELAGFGNCAQIEPDLQEWDYGGAEGRTTAEIHTERPSWNVFVDGAWRGESVEDIRQRADRVLTGLRAGAGVTLLFSHGQFLCALAMRWIGLPVVEGRHFTLDPASVCRLDAGGNAGDTPLISFWNVSAGPPPPRSQLI